MNFSHSPFFASRSFSSAPCGPRPLAFAVGSALVHLVVHLLVAEHRRVGRFPRLLVLRVFHHHGVECRSALLPALLEVEQVRHRVLDLVHRRPVGLDDARELELREIVGREVVGYLLVQVGGQIHRLLVTGAADTTGADRFQVPAHRGFAQELGGLVRALALRVVGVLLFDELVVDANLVIHLFLDGFLVARVDRRRSRRDLPLVEARLVTPRRDSRGRDTGRCLPCSGRCRDKRGRARSSCRPSSGSRHPCRR